MKALLIVVVVLVAGYGFASQQNPQLQWVERLSDGSAIIKIDGVEHRAFTQEQVDKIALRTKHLEETKADLLTCRGLIDRTQADLQKEKNNVQDERVKYGQLKQIADSQSRLLDESIALSKQGGKVNSFLNKWPVRLTTEIVIPGIQTWRCQ